MARKLNLAMLEHIYSQKAFHLIKNLEEMTGKTSRMYI